jgi:hypothetical protein
MVVTSGGSGFAAWTNSSVPAFRGAGGGVMPYSVCADTARPGQLTTSRSRRRQRGGRCPCQMGGASRKNRKWRGSSRKNRFTRKQRVQCGGAGVSVNPMDNMLGKVPVYDTTPCQMPLSSGMGVPPAPNAQPVLTGGLLPTQIAFRSRRRQRGGALVGSPIESMTQSISGSSLPASGLVYPASTAAYSFDLAGSKNFKDTYAVVAPMNGRVGPAACRSRSRRR